MRTGSNSCHHGGDHGPPDQRQDRLPPVRTPRKFARHLSAALLVLALLVSAGLAGASPAASDSHIATASPAAIPWGLTQPDATIDTNGLGIDVFYGYDLVIIYTAFGTAVDVTLYDGVGAVKGTAQVVADASGQASLQAGMWDGDSPDILPGDGLVAVTDAYTASVDPIGAWRMAELDEVSETVSAELHAPGLPNPVQAYCEAWANPVTTSGPTGHAVSPAGGTLSCDLDNVGWDLQRDDIVVIYYLEPDGDRVYASPPWPWRRVNIADDWVGGAFPAGTEWDITVTDDVGSLKATAHMISGYSSDWGTEGFDTRPWNWVPAMPDIVPDDVVVYESGLITSEVKVGTLTGTVDVDADTISGQITVPDMGSADMPVECHPWGAWDAGLSDVPIKESTAAANGSSSYTCTWDSATEWDVQHGQRIAVMYIEPDGDRVIDVFSEPAAYLRLHAESASVPAPGGNVRLHLEVANEGDADAENVTINALQDPADGLLYLSDTSGITPANAAGVVTWAFGTLAAGESLAFDVYLSVGAGASGVLTSTLTAETSSPTAGELWERTFTQLWSVQENDTRLSVGKWSTVDRPAPDQDVEYGVSVCNDGTTSSGSIALTDTPGPGQALVSWWADGPGWSETGTIPGELTAELPVLDPGQCENIHVVAHLAADVGILETISNTGTISGGNDLTPEDNESVWEGQVGAPWVNLKVIKSFSGGRLVPGGMLRYDIEVRNEGNIPSEPLTITDTFPASTAFDSSWTSSFWGSTDLPPSSLTGTQAVWVVPALGPGHQFSMGLALQIAGDAVTDMALINRVAVSSDAPEVRYDDNFSETARLLYSPGPNLSVVKRAAWLDGEHIGYDVFFDNLGSTIVSNVMITDTLPSGTTVTGEVSTDLEDERILSLEVVTGTVSTISLEVDQLYPGERHWLGFVAALDGADGIDSFLNSVEITLPAGDVNPADNSYGAQVDRPRPLDWVEVFVNDSGSSSISGGSPPGTDITITTPLGNYVAWADPSCGGCWAVEDLGLLEPGDLLSVQAGTSTPLQLAVPDPFTAAADSQTDVISGEARLIAYGLTDIYGDWGANAMTWTDADGTFSVTLDDVPPGGTGTVHIRQDDQPVPVFWARPFSTLDLVLEVNYAHDWLNAPYESGHDGTFTVKAGDGVTVKATAALESQAVTGWGGWTGFTTILSEPWVPERPDMVPGDWVEGLVIDNGREATLRLGTISATLDVSGGTG